MFELWKFLTPVLLADIVNPVLFAFMVYAVSTKQPVINSIAVLSGHTLAYFSAGIVLAIGLESMIQRLENPQHMDFYIGLLVGVLLLIVGALSCRKSEASEKQQVGELTVLKALGIGAIVNFIGIPFALPYFAAIDQILKADFSSLEALLVLLSYNLFYALPFTIVPILVVVMGDRSQAILQTINAFLKRVSRFLMPLLLLSLGGALVADAMNYFVTGQGLF